MRIQRNFGFGGGAALRRLLLAAVALLFLSGAARADWRDVPYYSGATFTMAWGIPELETDDSISVPFGIGGFGYDGGGGFPGPGSQTLYNEMLVPEQVVIVTQARNQIGIYDVVYPGHGYLTGASYEWEPPVETILSVDEEIPSDPHIYGGMAAHLAALGKFTRQYPYVYGERQLTASVWVICSVYTWIMDPSDPTGNTGWYAYSGQARVSATDQESGTNLAIAPTTGRAWPALLSQLPPPLSTAPMGYTPHPPHVWTPDFCYRTPAVTSPTGGPGGPTP